MTIADRRKIEELLFGRLDIASVDIAKTTGIPYISIAKYRTGERSYLGINLETSIKLTKAYEQLK